MCIIHLPCKLFIMYILLCLIIILATFIIYWGISKILSSDNNILFYLLWPAPFIILGILLQTHAFYIPILSDTIYTVYIAICLIIQWAMIMNCSIKKDFSFQSNIITFILKPIALDIICFGILMPFLYGINFLYQSLTFSIIYLNGAIFISAILCTYFTYYNTKRKEEGMLSILFTFLICLFHALLTTMTASILIPIILRIVYGIFLIKPNKKKST